MCAPIAEYIIGVSIDGVAQDVLDISEFIDKDKKLAAEIEKEVEEEEIEKEDIDTNKQEAKGPEGKLILAEEIATGHVSWTAIKLYLIGLGGSAPFMFMFLFLLGGAIMDGSLMMSVWFLGYWGTQYEHRNPQEVDTVL